MRIQHSFTEYVSDRFEDELSAAIDGFLKANIDTVELPLRSVRNIDNDRLEIMDINVKRVQVNDQPEMRISFDVTVEAEIYVCDSDHHYDRNETVTQWFLIRCKGDLAQHLDDFSIYAPVEVYNGRYKQDDPLSDALVPLIKKENLDKEAEKILKEFFPSALETPMALDPKVLADKLGLTVRDVHLSKERRIFGKCIFKDCATELYDVENDTLCIEQIPAGTILVDENVFFMNNIGTYNNTIIHECVHWIIHKKAFALAQLYSDDLTSIGCRVLCGIDKHDKDSFDWMEWQANSLAPKIQMPYTTTKKFIGDRLYALRRDNENLRDAEVMKQVISDTASFFKVSILAAKIRAIELGFIQAQGVFVYIDGRYLPPFSFSSDSLSKNRSFVIENLECLREILFNNKLYTLWDNKQIVFVNNMLCVNNSKYVTYRNGGHVEMTEYALGHIDECCFLFSIEKTKSHFYDDDFYFQCFLCHELTLESHYIYKYNPKNKEGEDESLYQHNQKVETLADEIDSNPDYDEEQQKVLDYIENLSFGDSLTYLMESVICMPIDVLEYRAQVSHTTISDLRTGKNRNPKIETLLKLFVGLHLNDELCEILLKKAKIEYPTGIKGRTYRWLIVHATDPELNLIDWQRLLDKKITDPNEQIKLYDPQYIDKGALSPNAKAALKRDVIDFYKAGHTYEETAAHFGSSKSTVQRWVKSEQQ